MARLFGTGRLEPMRAYMLDFAARFWITDMQHPSRMPNTRSALAAAEYARDRGRLPGFRRAAMDAYWREAEDLEDEEVVARVARAAELDPDRAVAAMTDPEYLGRVDAVRREATEAGVRGIPTFFIGDEVVVGCQPYEVLAAAVERADARRKDSDTE